MWNSKKRLHVALAMLLISANACAQSSFFAAPVQDVHFNDARSPDEEVGNTMASCAELRISPLGNVEHMRESLLFEGEKIPLRPGYQTQFPDRTGISVSAIETGIAVSICPQGTSISELYARLERLQYDSGARNAAARRRMYREQRLIQITVYPAETSWTLNTDSLPMN